MPDKIVDIFSQPVIQYGFAGLSSILLAILFWMIRKLVAILEQTAAVITHNTDTIKGLLDRQDQMNDDIRNLHNKLISRPCIAKRE